MYKLHYVEVFVPNMFIAYFFGTKSFVQREFNLNHKVLSTYYAFLQFCFEYFVGSSGTFCVL